MTCFTGLILELTSTTRDVSSSLGPDAPLLRRVRALELSTARGRTALAAPDTPAPVGAACRHYNWSRALESGLRENNYRSTVKNRRRQHSRETRWNGFLVRTFASSSPSVQTKPLSEKRRTPVKNRVTLANRLMTLSHWLV